MNVRKITEFLSQDHLTSVVLYHSDPQYKLIDWKLNGCFSKLEKKGIITGKYGEVTLAPVLWNSKQFKFYVIGMGDRNEPDAHLKGLASGFQKRS